MQITAHNGLAFDYTPGFTDEFHGVLPADGARVIRHLDFIEAESVLVRANVENAFCVLSELLGTEHGQVDVYVPATVKAGGRYLNGWITYAVRDDGEARFPFIA